jgi:hypothetical protein
LALAALLLGLSLLAAARGVFIPVKQADQNTADDAGERKLAESRRRIINEGMVLQGDDGINEMLPCCSNS